MRMCPGTDRIIEFIFMFVLLLCVKFIIQSVTVSAHVQVFCECLHVPDFMLVLSMFS